jgi:cellulose synthase/poly-beta-1,6-N-acetylglucosamine synthase-like glycosyltransferase
MIASDIVVLLQFFLLLYFGFSSAYLLLFAISSFFYSFESPSKSDSHLKFLILIPAYKEDGVIITTAKENIKQNYPTELFDVYIVADSFESNTIESLRDIKKINCIEVSFEKSTKARSINKALQIMDDRYDGVVILDADNIMEKDFLKKVNRAMLDKHLAIQGHRVAKNLNTSFAILDAISEEVNNTIFRKGHVAIGLSSALIGSGMAFDFNLYKSVMGKIDTYADEDKELEIRLFLNRTKVTYLNDAYVFDEKVSNSSTFIKQRSRWISSQIFYARTYAFKAIYQLFAHSNIDLFNKILQFMLPPRILLLGLTLIISTISFFTSSIFLFYCWLIVFSICFLAIALSVPKKYYNVQTYKSLLRLPYGFLVMGIAVIQIKLGHRRLSPTPHSSATLEPNKNIDD